jgi:hypothetical protein
MESDDIGQERIETILSGVAGHYFVAAELSRRGLIATTTVRNTRGVDVLVASADGTKSLSIQVKTNQTSRRKWMLSKTDETNRGKGFFYVFVRLNGAQGTPMYHVVKSAVVAKAIADSDRKWHSSSKRDGTPRKKLQCEYSRIPTINIWTLGIVSG